MDPETPVVQHVLNATMWVELVVEGGNTFIITNVTSFVACPQK